MKFEYDQQTFDDLEIIKHHSAEGQSLFRLFNITRTQGGALYQKKIMRNPTTLGFPVPANTLRTSLYSGIITTINLSDNLTFGYSHFYAEVKRVKEAAIALAEGKQMFVIFDELFRGTNVKDAFEASTEIIKAFVEISESTFFLSTHIVEIADEVKDKQSISFKYFDSEIINNNLKYSYSLKNGVSNERLGMYIVKQEGVFELLKSVSES